MEVPTTPSRHDPLRQAIVEALAGEAPGLPAVALLNFPSNPGGYSPTAAERAALVEGLLAEADRRPTAWPTYRHDIRRSGSTRAEVPVKLKRHWQASIGGRVSACTVAGGNVFAAAVDQHRVCALDAEDGLTVWTAGDEPASYCTALPITFRGRRYVVAFLENALAIHDLAAGERRTITVTNPQTPLAPDMLSVRWR